MRRCAGKRCGLASALSSPRHLPTTLTPTKNTILRVAREMGRSVELIDVLLDGAFGLSQEAFKQRMREGCMKEAHRADVILFAQGSMAYCEELVASKHRKANVVKPPLWRGCVAQQLLVQKGLIGSMKLRYKRGGRSCSLRCAKASR